MQNFFFIKKSSESLNEHPDITNGYASCLSLIVKTVAVFLTILTSLYAMSTLYGEARLPILMEIPYLPADGWPFFHINYGIELVLMWLGSNIAAGTELFTFFFIHFVRCRIEILVRMVEQWNNNINYNRHRDINVRQNGLLLEEIVRYHSSVKQNMAAIQRIFSPMLMATLLSSTIVICMCLIIITINPLLKIFPHIVLALGQNFMYCFVGNLLILQVTEPWHKSSFFCSKISVKNFSLQPKVYAFLFNVQSDKLYEQIILVDFYYLNVSERKSYLNVVRNAGYPIKLRSYFVTVDMALFFKVR